MRVVPPVTMTSAKVTSSSAAEPHAPSAWSGATTYGVGALVSVAADYASYESLASSNFNNTPNSSPLWWRKIGVDETAYNAATTYALGATCSSAANHRVYESLQASNVGNPLPVLPEKTTDYWLDIGPTNKWAMFDLERNTQTVYASGSAPTATTLTVVVTPGERCNSLAILGLDANNVTIAMSSGGLRKYPYAYDGTKTYAKGQCCTVSGATSYKSLTDGNLGHTPPNATYWVAVAGAYSDLSTRQVLDGYDYAFLPFDTRKSVVVFDIPPYTDAVITVTATKTTGNVKIGSFVVGTYGYVGDVGYGADADALNFSTIDRDEFGTSILVARRTVPRTSQTLSVSKDRVDKVRDIRTLLNAIPAVWSGLDDATSSYFESLLILGIYKKFSINIDTPGKATVSLELEEI